MGGYIGPDKDLTSKIEQRVQYTAAASQTTFAATYTPGYVDVYVNGVRLGVLDYTATNGTTVVLAIGCDASDEVEIIGRIVSKPYDYYIKSQIDSMIPPYGVAVGSGNAMNVTFSPVVQALVDGAEFKIRVPSANTVTNPSVTFNNLGIAKTITKMGNLPLQANDLLAGMELTVRYNSTGDRLEIISFIGGGLPTGTIIEYAGTTAPSGFLVCPTSATTVSRSTYSALYAAIEVTWGSGDGSTTFGIPWYPADYASVQASANVGTNTAGQMPSHLHSAQGLANAAIGGGLVAASTAAAATATNNTGLAGSGTNNLAAGVRVLKCIKY